MGQATSVNVCLAKSGELEVLFTEFWGYLARLLELERRQLSFERKKLFVRP